MSISGDSLTRGLRSLILGLVAVGAVGSEIAMAPWVWDHWTSALAYARGQLFQGWDPQTAIIFLGASALRLSGPPLALAALPAVAGWLLGRWNQRPDQ